MNQYETPRNLYTLLAVLAVAGFVLNCLEHGFSILVFLVLVVSVAMAVASWWCWNEEEEYLRPRRELNDLIK